MTQPKVVCWYGNGHTTCSPCTIRDNIKINVLVGEEGLGVSSWSIYRREGRARMCENNVSAPPPTYSLTVTTCYRAMFVGDFTYEKGVTLVCQRIIVDLFPVLKILVICVMCLLTYHARLGHFIKSEERLTVTATFTAICISTRRLQALNYGDLQFKDILTNL